MEVGVIAHEKKRLGGNVGVVTGGLAVFPDARPDDGELDIGIVTAEGPREWVRVFTSVLRRKPGRSPLGRMARNRHFDVRLARDLPYEIDGGDRDPAKHLDIHVEPLAAAFRVP